jgi:hypothetical protein
MAGLMAQASSVKPNPLAASTTKSLAVPAADLPKVVEAIEAQFPSAKLHAVVMENAGYMPDGETPACPFACIQ